MRILYGVVGEGMGHATRSKVVIDYLTSQGNKIKAVASGRAFQFLKKTCEDVVEIKGLTLEYQDGAVNRDWSIMKNVLVSPKLLLDNASAYFESVQSFGPDLVISDFDSFAYLFAKRHGIPIISIDNQQIIHRCKHDDEIKKGALVDFESTKAFVKAKLPGCDYYLITSFFQPKVRKKYAKNTSIVPPILRKAIIDATPSRGNHVIVYQTSTSDNSLVPTLNKLSDHKFIIYGLRRDAVEGNCTIKDFSEDGFVKDLASCRAVITNAGLSLMHEAIYLHKPVFSVPVRHQFEQEMNARYLERLGYGLAAPQIQSDTVDWFLKQEKRYVDALQGHKQDGNKVLESTLDTLVAGFGQAKETKKTKKTKSAKANKSA